MRYQILKAWRDVRTGGGKSLLVIFALALGLWGVGSVGVAYRVLSRDLRQNFLGTVPPHAIVTFQEPGRLDLGKLLSRPEIEAAGWRDHALLRIEVRPDVWVPLSLYGADDFTQASIAKVRLESGAASSAVGSIRIERNGRRISNLDTGSVARVRTGDRNLAVPVSGLVFDPGQAPGTQDHVIYAYTDPRTFSALSGEIPGRRLLIRWRNVHSKADVEKALATLRASWEGTGPTAASVNVPAFLEHPHQWQLNLLIAIIGTIGLLAFLLSSVLVSQVVAALLAKQTRQVGILKAVGATRSRIMRIYALYLGLFAVASGLVAIPLAVATGYGFSKFCAAMLNFEILTTRLPGDVLVALILAALVLPFLFAGPTLLRAGRISVREAIAEPRIRMRRRLSKRMVVSVLATALGVAIFSTGFNIRQSLFDFLTSTRDSMRFDLQVATTRPVPREAFSRALAGLSGIDRTEAWSGGKGELQTQGTGTSDGIGIVALPLDSRMVALRMVEGLWLESPSQPEAVLNQAALHLFHQPKMGQVLSLRIEGKERQARLVGIVEEIDKPKVYLAQTFYDRWANPEHRVDSLLLTAKDQSFRGVMALKKEIERAVAASDLPVLFVMSRAERTKIIADHLNIILMTLLILAFLVLWVAALGMASATSITVMERTREIGVLRAIGATPQRILRRFVTEGMTTNLAGLALGLILSWPLSRVASAFFGKLMLGEGAVLRYAFSPIGFAITVATSIVFGLLATRLPAGAAVRISTREALAYE
ncbi:MAG TPA: FtsX-like permease family protein [Thermoanaerobaculia bacterium]|jgi:putative ABC transport system permease protein|nr:FtsX-like permease family protein [Thermoanaerobaculia bacterium]